LNIISLFRRRKPPTRRVERPAVPDAPTAPAARPTTNAPAAAAAQQQAAARPQSGATRQAARHYLAAHAVEKSFGARKVVKGVTLYVRRGEAVGLLGPNGAGKTTVFYMITGLIAADRGRIELDGYDVTVLPMYQRARLGIGYLPQEASIFRGLNVEDNIRAVLEVVEPDRRRREADLNALLEEFNITRLRKTPTIAVGRRAPPCRNRPRLGDAAELHAARRAVCRHRPDRRRRYPAAGAPSDQPRHRRADHRPQCSRDARPDRPRLHHLFR
jgi:ABC-type glutathione transport system ATPase component